MTRRSPLLAWNTHAQEGVLTPDGVLPSPHRLLDLIQPDLNRSDPSGPFFPLDQTVRNGGARRQTLPARIGPICRDGLTIHQTFILREGTGCGPREKVQTRREKFTAQDLREMLSGVRKMPGGITEKQARVRLSLLEEREETLRRNGARARQHAIDRARQGRQTLRPR